MIGALLDLMSWAAHTGWDILTGSAELFVHGTLAILGLLWDLLAGALDIAWSLLRWAADLLFAPITASLDRLWDFGIRGCWDWASLFLTVFLTLLGACALLVLLATGAAVWRKLKAGQKHELGPKL